jgi:DNA polymerase-3 subunit epsilon
LLRNVHDCADLVDTYRCTGLSLEESCYQFDVALDVQYHSAMGDVEATANLALSLLQEGELCFDGGQRGLGLPTVIPRSTVTIPRRSAAKIANKQSGFLASLADRVVYSLRQDDETRLNYLSLLREALEDRVLDEYEIETLSDFAEIAGLGRAALEGLHKEFLAQMVCVALEDGVITEHELSDLKRLTRLLDLSPDTLEEQIAAAEPRQSSDTEKSTTDLCGSTVCCTGTIISNIAGEVITKNRAKELAAAAGLIPKSGVSKSLDILVVADPDTLSGKAKKAREYGIRIIVERDFWAMIGVEVN